MEEGTLARTSKGAVKEGRTILWVDESGFYLLPGVVRTWARRGETPVLKAPLSRDHLSVISALSADGEVVFAFQEHSYRGEDVVEFLKALLEQFEGKLLVIWDGAPIHRSKNVKEFLAEGGARRLQLERLPGYAPELNPDEGVWNHLKSNELKNVCCHDLPQLRQCLQGAMKRLQQKPELLKACVRQCGYAI